MKLTGSKLLNSAILTLASTAAIAAPDLVEFSAGTPAKAEEVNSNFSNLKTFTTGIEGRVTLIENSGRSDTISTLQGKVTALEIVDHSAPITALNSRVTPLESLDLPTVLPTLQNKVSALESVDHAAPVTALTNRVTLLENVDHSTPIITLQGRFTPLESSISTLEGKVTALENSDISAEILDLQTRIAALESSSPSTDTYTISVYGDSELIGHTNGVLLFDDSLPYLAFKTPLGMASLGGVGNSNNYYLNGFNGISGQVSKNTSIYFTDAACSADPSQVIISNEGTQFSFSKSANVVDDNYFISNTVKSYIINAGTTITKTTTDSNLYALSTWGGGSCSSEILIPTGSLIIPATELSEGIHNLKSTYSSITIDGYITN